MSVEFEFDFAKAREAILYLASRSSNGVEKLTAAKLLFLADKYHLVRFGRPITGDRYFAMPMGPVPTTILDLLNEILEERPSEWTESLSQHLSVDQSGRWPRFVANEPLQPEFLSESDVRALDEILRRHGSKKPGELIDLTHETPAYEKAWDARGTLRSVRIPFEDFFEEDPDAVQGVQEEMVEDFELRRAFPALRAIV